MKLYADIPKSKAYENCIKRAYQMTSVQWYPRELMPANIVYTDGAGEFVYTKAFHHPYGWRQGMAYSSCRATEKFVGYNISMETFMTATENPHSILYTRNLHGVGAGSIGSYYGIVCSCFVSYVTGRPYRTVCKAWPELTEEISTDNLDNLQLCDIVDNPQKHIAIITGLWRDEEGHVQKIEISESVLPTAVTRTYVPEQFYGYWVNRGFRVFRYKLPEDLSYTPSPYAPLPGEGEPDAPVFEIMTNWGNKANCLLNDEPVELSVLKGEWDKFIVTSPDGTVKTYTAGTAVPVDCPTVGDYTAYAVKGDKKSAEITWHVHDLQVKVENGTISFRNAEKDPVFHCIINKEGTNGIAAQYYLTETEAAAGVFAQPQLPAGKYWCIVMANNSFGTYVSNHFSFEITE